jgi:hypothetical protein
VRNKENDMLTEDQDTRARLLRAKALGLLEEAGAIDGLKPFLVTHQFGNGAANYLLWSREAPNEAEAESVLDAEFEPDRDEYLGIDDTLTLQELTGLAPTARLDDILESDPGWKNEMARRQALQDSGAQGSESTGQAYGFSSDDVLIVLEQNACKVADSGGKPFDVLAEELASELDGAAIEKAALRGGVDLDDQTAAANEEILRQLQESGVIKGPRPLGL